MNWRAEEDILHPFWRIWDWWVRVVRLLAPYVLWLILVALLVADFWLVWELYQRLEWLDANYRP